MTPLGHRAVDPFGNPTWEGMQYGLLDQTPVLTRQPTNPTIADYLTEFQDRNRAWRESFKAPEYTPWSGRPQVEEEEEVVDPAADPILGRWRKPPVDFQDERQDDFNPDPLTAANNWGWSPPIGAGGILGAPGGFVMGGLQALGNMTAADMAMGNWAANTGLTPSLLDHLTQGSFDKSGLYDKTVELMNNWNIAGRAGLLGDPNSILGQAKIMDYTHKYGGPEVDPYAPDVTTETGKAVADIAWAQKMAADLAYLEDMTPGDGVGPGGFGGDHVEAAAGEMAADDYGDYE